MKIGIDGSILTISFECGQKRYLTNLIDSLAKIDKVNEYFIFAQNKVHIPKQENFNLIIVPSIPFLKRQIFIPLYAKMNRVDIFHNPDVIGSVFAKHFRTVTTIHDLAPNASYPNLSVSPKYFMMRLYNNFVKKFTIKNSAHLITVSESVKSEIIKSLKVPIPITVTKEGVSDKFTYNSKLSKSYFLLAMADFSPRKNIERTLEAFALAKKTISKKIKLKVIVSTNYPIKNIKKKSKSLKIQRYIEIEKGVSSEKLITLYRRAIVFLYPSLYEGFGLPILEAMACGCPVITSNYGAMKEISGNAALLINPRSTENLASEIIHINKTKKLQSTLILRGVQNAKKYSWVKTARLTLMVYKKLYDFEKN